MGSESFRRESRLRSAKDFQRLARGGRRYSSTDFVLIVARAREPAQGGVRLGITVSRRVGSAVTRNRVKRAIREWFRRSRTRIPSGEDWVLIARPSARHLGSTAIATVLDDLLQQRLGDQMVR